MSFQQGTDDISMYYTKFKSIWKELAGYKPTFSCTCGGLQQIHTHHESEYVMSFLMGLNDSFSQIRGQILLSDPLPSIGNVFSPILHEEAQREIVVTHSPTNASNNIAFFVNSASKNQYDNTKGKYIKKERPKCAHCDMLGHTKDKWYKLVGYPPNYFKNHTSNSVNQVHDTLESSHYVQAPTLTTTQCQQLISFLTNHMKIKSTIDVIATNVIGMCMNVAFNNDHHTWTIDIGATSHICCFKEFFNSYTAIFNSHVLLPNSTKVKVEGISSIKINEEIFLHNVMFIPTFRFNLLSFVTLINTNPF